MFFEKIFCILFGSAIFTISQLSSTCLCYFRPFPSDIQGPGYHREDEEDIYAPLEDLAR